MDECVKEVKLNFILNNLLPLYEFQSFFFFQTSKWHKNPHLILREFLHGLVPFLGLVFLKKKLLFIERRRCFPQKSSDKWTWFKQEKAEHEWFGT